MQARSVGRAGALAAVLALAGCGTADLFTRYDLPEGPGVADAPYPRLVDVPEAPPPGRFDRAAPDPAAGIAVQVDLSQAAADQNARAAALNAPVLSDAERRRLGR
ncbi:MAG: hypothetical protein AAF677_05830 [Pseudomonadota bacterium]